MPETTTKRKGFLLFLDQYEPIKNLSLEQKGELLDAMFAYNMGAPIDINDPLVKMAFGFFKAAFDRDFSRRSGISEKRKGAARVRWDANDANACFASDENANDANAYFASDENANDANAAKEKIRKDNNIITPPYPPTGGEGDKHPRHRAKRSRGGGEYSDGFLAFWEKYPRKVNKGTAWKAYAKAESAGLLPDDLLDRLDNKRLCDDWQRDGGQYIPHPATWLNGRGWEDADCICERPWAEGWEDELNTLQAIADRCEAAYDDTPEQEAEKQRIWDTEYIPMRDDMRARGCRCV